MFNPQAVAQLLRLGTRRVAVVDDALHPEQGLQALRALSAKHWGAFEQSLHNSFPGPELALPPSGAQAFAPSLLTHAAPCLGLESTSFKVLSIHARLSLVSLMPEQLRPIQRVCHRDRLQAPPGSHVLAGVLYLFDEPNLGGTNFFDPTDASGIDAWMAGVAQMDNAQFTAETGLAPAYMTESNAHFTLQGSVDARQNRLIWYDGSQFHGSHITQPNRLQHDPQTGRLTLNVFAVCSI